MNSVLRSNEQSFCGFRIRLVLIDRYRIDGILNLSDDFYPGGRHEMRNEINREEVRANLLHWIDGFLSVKQQTN